MDAYQIIEGWKVFNAFFKKNHERLDTNRIGFRHNEEKDIVLIRSNDERILDFISESGFTLKQVTYDPVEATIGGGNWVIVGELYWWR